MPRNLVQTGLFGLLGHLISGAAQRSLVMKESSALPAAKAAKSVLVATTVSGAKAVLAAAPGSGVALATAATASSAKVASVLTVLSVAHRSEATVTGPTAKVPASRARPAHTVSGATVRPVLSGSVPNAPSAHCVLTIVRGVTPQRQTVPTR